MSDSVDNRIVEMQFKNSQFQSGVKSTLTMLGKLREALGFNGVNKNLEEIQGELNKIDMDTLNNNVSRVAKSFSLLRVAALTAFSTMVRQAVYAGEHIVASFTIDPIKEGFESYQQQINATKTILSNTRQSGTSMKQVTDVLRQMQHYAQLTVYNFADMAKNVGTFTANGVGLRQSAAAIKGIANLAAMSGASSSDASRAMYQLSQAISAGSVKLQDWNSVVNANIGTNTFKNALADTAVAMGTLQQKAVKFSGAMKNVTINGESFRNSLSVKGQPSWLTSKVLTTTLAQFTGQISKAKLLSEGFTKQQAKAIIATGKVALQSATQVKTWDQLTQALKEEVAGAYGRIFKVLLGNLPQATKLFSAMHNTLENLLTGGIIRFSKTLGDWAKLGGRAMTIKGIVNVFHDLDHVMRLVSDAWHSVFPPTTGATLAHLSAVFEQFTEKLKMGGQTSQNFKDTFKGLFSILDLAKQIIGGAVKAIFSLLGVADQGTGGFLAFTGSIGRVLYSFDQMVKKSGFITSFFKAVAAVLSVPLQLLNSVHDAIFGIFDGYHPEDAKRVTDSFKQIGDRVQPLTEFLHLLGRALSSISPVFSGIVTLIDKAAPKVVAAFDDLGHAIAQSFSDGNFNHILDAINTGLLAGIVLMVRRFFQHGLKFEPTGGLIESIKEPFEELTKTLKVMQTQIQAKTLKTIAEAIGLLTASVVVLSLINSQKLTKALSAMSVGFTELLGSMAVLTKISKTTGFIKMPIIAASMNLLASAMFGLSLSVAILSTLSWSQLLKGLTGVAVVLGTLAAVVKPLSANSKGMISVGVGLNAIATALLIMSVSLKQFGSMDWKTIGKGLVGIAGALLVVAGAMRLMPKNILLQSVALNAVATSLLILAKAVKEFSGLSWSEMGKGMAGIAAGLVIIAGALALMSPSSLLSAGALVLVSGALMVIEKVVSKMGAMSWTEIGKSMVELAGSLVILAGGLYLMTGTLLGSAALLVAAGALAVITPVLVTLGHLSWSSIVKGLASIAGVFTVLGVAGLLLTPLVPSILAVSAALVLMGAGMALAGAGALAFATAFSIFVAAGTAGVSVLKGLFSTIPDLFKELADGIFSFATEIAKDATVFEKAFVALASAILDGVIKIAPKLANALDAVIKAGLKVVNKNGPKMANAGVNLMLDLLRGINNHITQITNVAVSIIVRFLNALSKQMPKIDDAGARLMVSFVNGLSHSIKKYDTQLGKAGGQLALSLVTGMADGITAGIGTVVSAAGHLIGSALHHMHLGIHNPPFPSREGIALGNSLSIGFGQGITQYQSQVGEQAQKIGETAVATLRYSISKIPDVLDNTVDFNPTIAPVLDLTKLQKDATKISGLLSTTPITPTISTGQANKLSTAVQETQTQDDSVTTESTGATVTLTQINTSPKALSTIDIYRNTKNQLSLAKGALKG